jgi:hypothetical protein
MSIAERLFCKISCVDVVFGEVSGERSDSTCHSKMRVAKLREYEKWSRERSVQPPLNFPESTGTIGKESPQSWRLFHDAHSVPEF